MDAADAAEAVDDVAATTVVPIDATDVVNAVAA